MAEVKGTGLTDHLEVDVAGDPGFDRESGGEVPAAEVDRLFGTRLACMALGSSTVS